MRRNLWRKQTVSSHHLQALLAHAAVTKPANTQNSEGIHELMAFVEA